MKKSILLVIAILMMTFGTITNVKAETINAWYLPSNVNGGINGLQKTFTSDSNSKDIDFTFHTAKAIPTNAKYLTFSFYTTLIKTTTTNYIDLDISCSNYRTSSITSGGLYTITYQDGSTASISGTEYGYLCNLFESQGGGGSGTRANIEEELYNSSFNITASIGDLNNYNSSCKVEDNYAICPIPSFLNGHFTAIRLTIHRTIATSNSFYVGLDKIAYFSTNDNETIITEIQNQSNTQHNDNTLINNNITNLNDNILNSSLNSNTSSDASNIGSNDINSSSKNVILDFMLMPINFINNILNSFGNTCSTLCIGNCGSGHDNEWRFVFPCVDIKSIIGDTIYNTIDVLMCFGMVFAFLRSVVGFLKKALLLESDVSSEVRIF